MLTDAALKFLKPKDKPYKVSDRDGMYVLVSCGGTISFRLDYRLNGRRETVTLGKYSPADLSLALAREKCLDARRMVAAGQSPAIEKKRAKLRIKEAKRFGEFGEKWITSAPMADSTRAMRRSIFDRDVLPPWRNRLLTEISPGDIREHCLKIVARGAPATAIHVREIVKLIYAFAKLNGEKIDNPAEEVGPSSIATFTPRDRSLSPAEIRVLFLCIGKVATLPTIRLGLKFILLSMVRKSELQDAVWDEVDFENAVWSIPKERMKRAKAHNVYLSTQMLDILIALKTCAGGSRYLLPSRYDADAPMSRATFNRVTYPRGIESLFRMIAAGTMSRELRQAIVNIVERTHVFRSVEARVDIGVIDALEAMEQDFRFGRWTALRSKITSFHRNRVTQAGRVISELRQREEPLR